MPGPGYYNPKNASAFDSRYTPATIQQFGATSPRFIGNRTAFASTLGPGQYGDFRQSYVLLLSLLIENPEEKRTSWIFKQRKKSRREETGC